MKVLKVRVQAYRLGSEQREMQEARLRKSEEKRRDTTRKVSFKLT